jgi:hypothetical protein
MTARNKKIVWIGLPLGLLLAGLSFPGEPVPWMYFGAIAAITAAATIVGEIGRKEKRKAPAWLGAAILGAGYVLAGQISLPKQYHKSGWDAALTVWTGQLIATSALSLAATVLVLSLLENRKNRANKSPEATPGQRPPAEPSPSPGAPQL